MKFTLIVVATLALFFSSLGHFFSYLGDSPYNLYVAWRISLGDILFRDLTYYHGPLAQLFMGLSYRIAGSAAGPLCFNLILVGAAALFLFSSLKKLFAEKAAWVGVFLFLVVFAFSETSQMAHFQYIFPYKPEVTWAVFLAIFSLWVGTREWAGEKKALCLGIFAGGALLLSPEIIFALGSALIVSAMMARPGRKLGGRFVLGVCAPPLVVFLYFLNFLSYAESFRATFNALFVIFGNVGDVGSQFGVLNRTGNWGVAWILGCSAALAAFLSLLVLSAKKFPQRELGWGIGAAAALIVAIPIFFDLSGQNWWMNSAKCLPITTSLLLAFYFFRAKNTLLASAATFSLALLLKIVLNPSLNSYGFYHCMPSFILLACFLIQGLPLHFPKAKERLSLVFFCFFSAIIIAQFFATQKIRAEKTLTLGAGPDLAFVSLRPEQHAEIARVGEWLQANLKESETLQPVLASDLLPYLLRKPRATGFALDYFELFYLGLEKFMSVLVKKAPDYLLVWQIYPKTRETTQSLLPPPELIGWISQHYSRVLVVPEIPEAKQVLLVFKKK